MAKAVAAGSKHELVPMYTRINGANNQLANSEACLLPCFANDYSNGCVLILNIV